MAVLNEANRAALYAALMAEASRLREPLPGLTKADMRAAVDATDAWIDANAAAFNTALPVAVRTNLTARQKLQLFLFVARRRFEVG